MENIEKKRKGWSNPLLYSGSSSMKASLFPGGRELKELLGTGAHTGGTITPLQLGELNGGGTAKKINLNISNIGARNYMPLAETGFFGNPLRGDRGDQGDRGDLSQRIENSSKLSLSRNILNLIQKKKHEGKIKSEGPRKNIGNGQINQNIGNGQINQNIGNGQINQNIGNRQINHFKFENNNRVCEYMRETPEKRCTERINVKLSSSPRGHLYKGTYTPHLESTERLVLPAVSPRGDSKSPGMRCVERKRRSEVKGIISGERKLDIPSHPTTPSDLEGEESSPNMRPMYLRESRGGKLPHEVPQKVPEKARNDSSDSTGETNRGNMNMNMNMHKYTPRSKPIRPAKGKSNIEKLIRSPKERKQGLIPKYKHRLTNRSRDISPSENQGYHGLSRSPKRKYNYSEVKRGNIVSGSPNIVREVLDLDKEFNLDIENRENIKDGHSFDNLETGIRQRNIDIQTEGESISRKKVVIALNYFNSTALEEFGSGKSKCEQQHKEIYSGRSRFLKSGFLKKLTSEYERGKKSEDLEGKAHQAQRPRANGLGEKRALIYGGSKYYGVECQSPNTIDQPPSPNKYKIPPSFYELLPPGPSPHNPPLPLMHHSRSMAGIPRLPPPKLNSLDLNLCSNLPKPMARSNNFHPRKLLAYPKSIPIVRMDRINNLELGGGGDWDGGGGGVGGGGGEGGGGNHINHINHINLPSSSVPMLTDLHYSRTMAPPRKSICVLEPLTHSMVVGSLFVDSTPILPTPIINHVIQN